MNNNKKLSIIAFSGDFDKAFAVFTLASGAAAINYEVNLFFTFWGLNIIKKNKNHAFLGSSLIEKVFNFLLGGRNKMPLSKLNFFGLSPIIFKRMLKKKNIASLEALITSCVSLGVNFYVCEASFLSLGFKKEDFIPEIKSVVDVGQFLRFADQGQIIFI
ncbi:MAG: DsrE/DsrF/DrsH-like family protein [Candidatus Margulisiibacteriota bacterium]|jgi:peroxiredoxin family protein